MEIYHNIQSVNISILLKFKVVRDEIMNGCVGRIMHYIVFILWNIVHWFYLFISYIIRNF